MVFPAHAGMSPSASEASLISMCFPRPRGDEPVERKADFDLYTFSPPTRG